MKNKVIKHVNSTLKTRNLLGSIVSGVTYVKQVNLSNTYSNISKVAVKDLGNGYGEVILKKK